VKKAKIKKVSKNLEIKKIVTNFGLNKVLKCEP